MNFEYNEKTQDYLTRIKDFISTHVEPVEQQVYQELEEMNPTGDWTLCGIYFYPMTNLAKV